MFSSHKSGPTGPREGLGHFHTTSKGLKDVLFSAPGVTAVQPSCCLPLLDSHHRGTGSRAVGLEPAAEIMLGNFS